MMMSISSLQQRFTQTVQRLTPLQPHEVDTLWHRLAEHYNEPHRHYHTLSHLEFLFDQFDTIEPKLTIPDSVALAIFYHDVIYHTDLSSDANQHSTQLSNEAQSALWFDAELGTVLPTHLTEQVKYLIRLTERHQLDDTSHSAEIDMSNIRHDAQYFLDMDLSILGQSSPVYLVYCQQIRQEYAHIDESLYRMGRADVLKRFLARPRLYFSAKFFEQYEAVARHNLEQELARLGG